MMAHEEIDELPIEHRIPDEGSTIREMRRNHFGLIRSVESHQQELHGYVVTMEGTTIIPELRPGIGTT